MAFLVKDPVDILTQALRKLSANTSLNATGPGSVVRALTEAVTTELGDFYDILDFNLSMQVVTTSSGRALDLLGTLYNVQRKNLSALAAVDRSLGSFYFYLDSPSGSNITIPGGVQIFTNTTDFVGTLYTFQTTDAVTLPAGRTRVYASIIPLYSDSVYTAGKNTLVSHNFTNLPNGVVLKCTNPKPINPQTAYEDDDTYRVRIIKAVRTAAGGTAEAVRFAGLNVDGVRDITIREAAFGLGSFEVIIVASDSSAAGVIRQLVTEQVNTVRPVGVRMIMREPDLLLMDIKASILLGNQANVDAQGVSTRARTAILRYLNRMLVGTPMVYSQLIQSILDASEFIVDVSILELAANGEEILRRNFNPLTDQQIIPGNIEVVASVVS